jgi:TonB-linked SusC/RagA family outer membrane protein
MKNVLWTGSGMAAICRRCKKAPPERKINKSDARKQTLLTMKILLLLTAVACLQAGARGYGQSISLNFKRTSLEKVFAAIEKQSHYHFIYTKEELENLQAVSIDVKNVTVTTALDICLKQQPVSYAVREPYIIIKRKEEVRNKITLRGKVMNEEGEAIAGATVSIKGTETGTACNEKGEYVLEYTGDDPILIVSSVGYEQQDVRIGGRTEINIMLIRAVGRLDETIVIGYGKTTRRLNTGSVGKLTAEDIEQQPVSNPLAAIEGRIPGLLVTQSTGVPGGSFKIQLRGRNSIAQANDPFIIIDGVPFAPNNSNINQIGAAFTYGDNGLSALNSINPNDIESIEILKDADATAIYGSRGANGVILITTKKGKAGETKTDISAYTGFSRITRSMDMMNTQQYLAMRREAFKNDNETMSDFNAYDLLAWDTTRYTDFKKMLIGGTAHSTDAQFSISGGTGNTQFLMGGNYHRETTVFPGSMANSRGSFHFNIRHTSLNQKLSINLTASYSAGKNNIIQTDLTKYINLPPNLPSLYDSAHNLNWSEGGFSFDNPLAFLKYYYNASVSNLLGNLQLQYKILPGLNFKTNVGYNNITVNEISTNPAAAQNPAYNPKGYAQFGHSIYKSNIIEPQLNYEQPLFKKGKLDALIGATWQENTNNADYTFAYGYTNDALLQSLDAAGGTSARTNFSQYRYAAVFGRLNYNFDGKYIFNLSGRRDGSSRFGPDRQFASFGAAGAAWIFSNEKMIQENLPFISFGKLRISYGSSGNDGIGDYKYLDTWRATNLPYQGNAGLQPTGLFNSDYGWEINKKLEAALELSFLKDRIQLTTAWYRNRSSNELVSYALPSQTGFTSISQNLPALIENRGWEFEFSSVNVKSSLFSWSSSLVISFPKNKLVSYPGLATSSYKYNYLIGEPLNIVTGFSITGVDPQTGTYQFVDHGGNIKNLPDYPDDLFVGIAKLDPKFYGGFKNALSYKKLAIQFFLEFRKQTGYSYLRMNGPVPGIQYNQPVTVLNRWQKPGDITETQQFTQSFSNPAYLAYLYANVFEANNAITDASFIRVKNISLSWTLPTVWIKKAGLSNLRLYLLAQNLFLITNYKGADPETQAFSYLPPLKTITGGIQISF